MTFQSVNVYLPEIGGLLLLRSSEKEKPRVYTLLISGQQHAACKDMVSPQIGDTEGSHLSVYALLHFPSPKSLTHQIDHRPYSSKMSSHHCLPTSKQTKLAMGAEQVAAARTCARKPSGSPLMSCICFPFGRPSLEYDPQEPVRV